MNVIAKKEVMLNSYLGLVKGRESQGLGGRPPFMMKAQVWRLKTNQSIIH